VTTLIDTNVLVYAAGIRTDQGRQQAAIAVLAQWRPEGCLALQGLAEFAAVALRHGMAPEQCRTIVEAFRRSWSVLVPSPTTVETALEGVARHGLSFWDAMVWALAREHEVDQILSEDGPTGQRVGGILFRNPFEE
jgi:predicted nucleic acid-binding protein